VSTLSPERWREISPHLEHALSLDKKERAAWLESFGVENPGLADLLRELLMEHSILASEKFLETAPEPPVSESSLAGQRIGAYTLLSPIGQGGMGSVWLAERSDGRFERQVAIKFLHFSVAAQGGIERFKREGRILGQLAHPNIAELIDAGVTPSGELYLVIEYVEGEPITEYCDKRSLDVASRIHLFGDVLNAVAHAHANLIVHRDLKPSNVLVRNDGQVKLLDFGIAKLLSTDGTGNSPTLLTMEAGGAFTPQFAAPEQITGGAITTATDMYALGTLLYLLLTGCHPAGEGQTSPAQLMKAITDTDAPRPSQVTARPDAKARAAVRGATPDKLSRQLQGDLDTIVVKATKKSPAERYGSVTAFADDLQRYLKSEPIKARPDSFGYTANRFIRRNRLAVGLTTLAITALVVGITVIVVQASTARRERDAALRQRDRATRVTDLLTSMFKISDPNETVGNGITAREVLDKASSQVSTELTNDPDLQAELMSAIGDVYSNLGLYDQARRLLEKSIQIGRVANPSDPALLRAMDSLGIVLIQQGSPKEAEQVQRQALEIQQRVLGPEAPDTLDTMGDLASSLAEQGRMEEAIQLASKTLEMKRRVLGTEGERTLALMDDLAAMYGMAGRFRESEQLEANAIAITRKRYGPNNLRLLNSMSNQGDTLFYLGRYDEARDIWKQVRDVELRTLGPSHPETARSTYNLGCVAAQEGKRDEAFAYLNAAIDYLTPRTAPQVANDPVMASLRRDRRYRALIERAKRRHPAEVKCPL